MVRTQTSLADRLAYERHFAGAGYNVVAGVDEVGRGALAGPLVAAAVILPDLMEIERDWSFWEGVDDSKLISHLRRADLAGEIVRRCPAVHVAAIPPWHLDAIGLGPANRLAMEFAVRGLRTEPDLLLIDAMTLDLDLPQVGIIDGDARSLAIAAASIVAKVTRDGLMLELDPAYPHFGFAGHKGYGVARHVAALEERGPCEHHRLSFAPVRAAWERHSGQS